MLTPREKLYEIDSLIAANASQIRHLRDLMNDPARAERDIANARKRADAAMAEIAQIENTQLHGWEMIDQHKARVEQLQNERVAVVNSVGIEKMKEMFLTMQQLKDNGPLDIAAIVEEIENEEMPDEPIE